MTTRSMIVSINRTIIEEDLPTSLTEDENESYRPIKKDTLRTPKKPLSRREPEASSSGIKSEPKTKTPRTQAPKGVSTTTTKKISPRKSATTLRQAVRTVLNRNAMLIVSSRKLQYSPPTQLHLWMSWWDCHQYHHRHYHPSLVEPQPLPNSQ